MSLGLSFDSNPRAPRLTRAEHMKRYAFWNDKKRLEILSKVLEGKTVQQIAQEMNWHLGDVINLVSKDLFLEKVAYHISMTFFHYQTRKIQLLDEAIKLLENRCKATIKDLPAKIAWQEYMKALQLQNVGLKLKDPKSVWSEVVEVGLMKISSPRDIAKNLRQHFGLPELPPDEEEDEQKAVESSSDGDSAMDADLGGQEQ